MSKIQTIAMTFAMSIAACTAKVESDPDKLVNHFKFWSVGDNPFARQVVLTNQFDEKDGTPQREETLNGLVYIGNPVTKNDTDIVNTEHHLLAYFIDLPEEDRPLRWVDISNQITNDEAVRWHLGLTSLLLTPASKRLGYSEPPEWPRTLNHYECQTVREAKEHQVNLTLVDQFDRKREMRERITTLTPAFFCLPVDKDGHSRVPPDIHLALYDIAPTAKLNPPIVVSARDQFDLWKLSATESLLLAVPTRKLAFGFDQ